ncbi:bifunctional helix-turn-helix transcriptional regulator/GNAT family N-acetyltransferase [Actinacidiphila bryophytorum]|uniref:bifunctional helix-turn-helix transcriptional regulator/GNAT family N-acetyltransferase n=1 Tax=Actinacidiphila bryophytorum TaxID=1436133 RepID=UPI002176A065|nr:bifunctional helix-turn-helix transcriptional regulator/GNAT family N-acetyltransferase [Actinacidiphila bryophytorum]UWE08339.1 bifunctional helix-turn-helix transcriptional regulator/GNAT family N-acetyltransferase [Actinacidiphila bryophytorum]
MAVREIREFNRFYTNLIGALDYSRHLHTPFTLTEARVLYELAHSRRTDAADLRAALSIDAGHLSRMLAGFEQKQLVTRRPSEEDARRQRIELTTRGREAAGLLEERSQEAVGSLVGRIAPGDRPRLTAAMRTVQDILRDGRPVHPAAAEVTLRGPRPGDLGWVVERNAAVYAEEFGWNSEYEALVARIVADFAAGHDPEREAVWIAEVDGLRAGCVFCVRDEAPGTARLRLLLVDPAARGHGIGRQLVETVISFARSADYSELVLWTNDVLASARSIYQRAGFELVESRPHHSFGKDLVGQDWRLAL